MNDSILTSVKKILGIEEFYEQFDVDIIIHTNSILAVLTQMGIGPSDGFLISGKTETWKDFLGDRLDKLSMIKSYVSMRVRLLFDPPQSSIVVNAMNESIKEFEYRLYISENPKTTFEGE